MFPLADNDEYARFTFDHIRHILETIGGRASCSPRRTPGSTVARRRIIRPGLQPGKYRAFPSAKSTYWPFAVAFGTALLGTFVGLIFDNRWLLGLGGLLNTLAVWGMWRELDIRPNWLRWLTPFGDSQNVIGVIQPKNELRRQVVVCAHLDTHRAPIFYSTAAWQRVFNLLLLFTFISMFAGAVTYYSEELGDFNHLTRYFITIGGVPRKQSTWCLGRVVDWKWALYENKRAYAAFCDENAHLWFDGFGELAGFAISESGDAGFHILTLEGYRFLYEEMLLWVLENWMERQKKGACLSTEITEHQDWEMGVLERYKFRSTHIYFTRRFDLTRERLPRSPLEPGFVIVDMKAHPDYRAQAFLRASALQKKNELSEQELNIRLKYYNHSIRSPALAGFDGVSPDNQHLGAADPRIIVPSAQGGSNPGPPAGISWAKWR